MKLRWITLVLTAALVLTALPVAAGAYWLPNTNVYNSFVHTDGINNFSEDQAEMLRALGLFLGTDQGFELDRIMNRNEAAAMLVRLLGAEEEAQNGAWSHPFTDVASWADGYVGWLYQKGLTKGTSATRYGGSQPVTVRQYALFLARVLAGSDVADSDWNTVADESEIRNGDRDRQLDRATAVSLTVRALLKRCTDGRTLTAHLVEQGVISVELLGEASFSVLPSSYPVGSDGSLSRSVAGVTVATCSVSNLDPLPDSLEANRTYFYASRPISGGQEAYRLDCKTLEVLDQAKFVNCDGLWYAGPVGDQDYLMACPKVDGNLCFGGLYQWRRGTPRAVWNASTLWDGDSLVLDRARVRFHPTAEWDDSPEQLLIVGSNDLFTVDANGTHRQSMPEKMKLLAFEDGVLVGICPTAEGGARVFAMDPTTGRVWDEYTVAPLKGLSGDDAVPTLQVGVNLFPGSAGVYRLENGHLEQLTDQPTAEYVFTRLLTPVFLTYTPGVTPMLDGDQTGDEIWSEDADGNPVQLLASGHGIRIQTLFNETTFQGVSPDGVNFNYAVSGGKIQWISLADQTAVDQVRATALCTAERERLAGLGFYAT